MESQPSESKNLVPEDYRRGIDQSIAKTGLNADAFNSWTSIMSFSGNKNPNTKDCDQLRKSLPIPKYEERYGVFLNDDSTVNERWSSINLYTRNSSDPEKVREYNEIVDKVNSDAERMIIEKDTETAGKYFRTVCKLLYGSDPK